MILCICLSPALQRSLFFESLEWERVNRANKVIYGVGGKGVNVARVIRQLEGDTNLILPIGGYVGKRVVELLNQQSIPHCTVKDSHQTRVCSTLLNLSQNTHTEIVEESPVASASAVKSILLLYKFQIKSAKCVILSGSVPSGYPDSIYKEMIHYANCCHVPVILDTVGAPFHDALSMKPWLVKPNKLELKALLNIEIESIETIKNAMMQLQGAGAQNVLVTWEGPEAILLYENAFYLFRNPLLNVVNSIGSGDALAAGLGLSFLNNENLLTAVKYGMACAGANVITPLAAEVHEKDVGEIYSQVTYVQL